jgi:hypothetical protein
MGKFHCISNQKQCLPLSNELLADCFDGSRTHLSIAANRAVRSCTNTPYISYIHIYKAMIPR